MRLSSALLALSNGQIPSTFEGLKSQLDPKWIDGESGSPAGFGDAEKEWSCGGGEQGGDPPGTATCRGRPSEDIV